MKFNLNLFLLVGATVCSSFGSTSATVFIKSEVDMNQYNDDATVGGKLIMHNQNGEKGINGKYIIRFDNNQLPSRNRKLQRGERNLSGQAIMSKADCASFAASFGVSILTNSQAVAPGSFITESFTGMAVSVDNFEIIREVAAQDVVAYVEQDMTIQLDDPASMVADVADPLLPENQPDRGGLKKYPTNPYRRRSLRALQPYTDKDTKADANTWGLDRTDQRDLPLDNYFLVSSTAPEVYAYILDTGVQVDHEEFGGKGGRAQWGENTSGDGQDRDCHGHGTHVAGTVGGTKYGMAKEVKIVAVKVLSCSGSGSTTGVINGIEWVRKDASANALNNKKATANLSLGGSKSLALNEAVKKLHNSGVVTVVAAGNDNANACNFSPASELDVITVGSTTLSDTRSSFSNYGTCVDIFAPGSSITAAWIGNGNNDYKTISGTSMASPHVCGASALKLQEGIIAAAVKGELINDATADKVTNPGNNSPNELLYIGTGQAAPTPPPCKEDSINIEVEVKTDTFAAGETAWEITDQCTGTVTPGPFLGNTNTVYKTELCLPDSKYIFTITDNFGDGVCCQWGQGYYQLTIDGNVMERGEESFKRVDLDFGTTDCDTNPVTPPPTNCTCPTGQQQCDNTGPPNTAPPFMSPGPTETTAAPSSEFTTSSSPEFSSSPQQQVPTTSAPQPDPTEAPSREPTNSGDEIITDYPTFHPTAFDSSDCEDRFGFRWNGSLIKDCSWLAQLPVNKRTNLCKRSQEAFDEDDVTVRMVYEWCPATCATVGEGGCQTS